MEQTWRWFGPGDEVTLAYARQAGARGIVSALHDIPPGQVWPTDQIRERLALITADKEAGLTWSVVESLPMPEAIKRGEGDLRPLFDAFRQSMRNLASCGIRTICYNFMPVLDWMRTDMAVPVPGGGRALRFSAEKYAAFDCFMLERPGAEAEQSPEVLARARAWFAHASDADKALLLSNIMAGLPGFFTRYDIPGLRHALEQWQGFTIDDLRRNYVRFLEEVMPTAEELGIRMGIHPDDPPRSLVGLPRMATSEEDIAFILDAYPSPSHGLTLCTGSLASRAGNDVPAIARRFASRTAFAHLRNVTKEADGSFQESEHLGGDVDMVAVVSILLEEQERRRKAGDERWRIPFRPDHGHELIYDIGRPSHPGYPAIGRLRGLAEIRGVMTALAAERRLSL